MQIVDAKTKGAYYTPTEVATTLVRWAIRAESDRMLDPSCGDGQFLRLHRNSAGIEQDPTAVAEATKISHARIYVGDFFDWAARIGERFDCVVGNPPFIRYQTFSGLVRKRALDLTKANGVTFSALTASWAPFLVGASTLLKSGGRMAFVVPAEVGHSPYAAPLIEFLAASFRRVQFVAIRESVFPHLSQDIWLLYADGFGGSTQEIGITKWDTFRSTVRLPAPQIRVPLSEWRRWHHRLRVFLLPADVLALYDELRVSKDTFRLGDVARVGIGYVTGANDFFHLRPSVARDLNIPQCFLQPAVRNSRVLPGESVDATTVRSWIERDDPCLLLRIKPNDEVPTSVKRYLDSCLGESARQSYKCRNRKPWYSVPDVTTPNGFMAYMSNRGPSLVANDAGCVCTNSIHAVRLLNGTAFRDIQRNWNHPLTVLSTEIEGHALGGGMLKIEPREAARIILPSAKLKVRFASRDLELLESGINSLRAWRHYD